MKGNRKFLKLYTSQIIFISHIKFIFCTNLFKNNKSKNTKQNFKTIFIIFY